MTDFKNRIVGHGSKPASQFQAHPNNWRKHPKNQRSAVKGSLDSLGWVAEVIENVTTGRLIDGHERVWNALQNGDAEVPFIQVELTEAEEAQALLSLDAIAALAETDREQVNALLEQVNTDNADVMQFLTDFAKESGLEWGQPEQGDAEPQIDRAAELLEKWQVKTGDLWQIGEHRLLCGDSTKREDVERVMEGEKAGAVVTDPPYGIDLDTEYSKITGSKNSIAIKQGKKRVLANDYEKVEGDDKPFDASLFVETFNYVREQFWFGANYYRSTLSPNDMDGSWLVWDKRPSANKDGGEGIDDVIGSGFELIWSKNKHQQRVLRYQWSGFTARNPEFDRAHPTEKPLQLLGELISRWTDDGCIVVDPFAGSGTTMVACQNLNRKCRAIEISPAYCSVILERMSMAFPTLDIVRV
jgi:DNA modification methylase